MIGDSNSNVFLFSLKHYLTSRVDRHLSIHLRESTRPYGMLTKMFLHCLGQARIEQKL